MHALTDFRAVRDADLPFILNSWLKSYRESSFARDIPSHIYFSNHEKIVKRLLAHARTEIAVDREDENHIFGYSCSGAPDMVHYIYVKLPFRRLGIGRALLDRICSGPFVYTHKTDMAKYFEGGTYDPYAFA